jgi:hypothetical protein
MVDGEPDFEAHKYGNKGAKAAKKEWWQNFAAMKAMKPMNKPLKRPAAASAQ